MIAGVADTHAALWYLLKNPLLSATACTFIDDAAAAGNEILLSPISLAEIVYLTEKQRLPISAYEELKRALADHEYVIEEAPFTAEIVENHAPGSSGRSARSAGSNRCSNRCLFQRSSN